MHPKDLKKNKNRLRSYFTNQEYFQAGEIDVKISLSLNKFTYPIVQYLIR